MEDASCEDDQGAGKGAAALGFHSLTDDLPAQIALLTAAGQVDIVNRQILEFFDMTIEQLRCWPSANQVHPEDLPRVIEAWQRSLATEEAYEIELRLLRHDGVFRWFHAHAQPLRNPGGRLVGWCALQTDIDDRKRDELLAAGEKRLLEMVAAGQPLPIILDALCRLLDATAEGCSSGVLLLDRTGRRIQHAVAPGLPTAYNLAIEGQLVSESGGPCGMAASLRKQVIVADVSTDTRWSSEGWPTLALAHGLKSCWSSPILARTGEALGTFAIYQRRRASPTPFHQALIQQLTHIASIAVERTRGEDALRRSQAFLAEGEMLSATGSFSWDASTGTHWWSDQTRRIFGVEPGQAPSFEIMRTRAHPDDLELLDHCIDCARRAEAFTVEFRLQVADGNVKHLQVVAHAAGLGAGESEFVGAVRDVTEQRVSEEALSKARSELAHVARVTTLGVLTASIAHEVNQPLAGIITNSSTCLLMLGADPPNVKGALETTRRTMRDGKRASDVITRLRALFGNKAVTAEAVDLNEATQEVLALLKSELQNNRIALRVQFASELPRVSGDRVQLQQVILNLVLNATAAMGNVDDRARQLVISTEVQERQRVRLAVRDCGVGLVTDDSERLFEAFYTTKEGGMGMGLSVSRSIIESHQGSLSAFANVGHGATFSFSIPHCAAQPLGET